MASFLVRPNSEHNVHITSVLNVQSASWHNVQQTSVGPKIHVQSTLRFKVQITFAFYTSFERSRIATTKKKRLHYVQKMTFIIRREFTFTNRFSTVFIGRTWIRRSSVCAQWVENQFLLNIPLRLISVVYIIFLIYFMICHFSMPNIHIPYCTSYVTFVLNMKIYVADILVWNKPSPSSFKLNHTRQ